MFYIKVNGQKKEITARNIYTLCPECGKEIQVDLTELIQPGEFDLEASTIWEKRIRYDGICTHILRSYWCRVIAHFQKVRRYEQGKQKGMSFLSRAYP